MIPYPSQSFAANRSTRHVSSSQSSLDLPQPSATQPTLVRAVGGIGEAPAQPKQTLSASHLISSTFNNPRLLNKFSGRQSSQNDTDTSGTLTHSSITLPTSLSYKRSHKKTYSDCHSISTDSHHHHIPTRSCTPTLPTVEIPSLIIPQNRIPRDKPPPSHHHLPSFSRSIVTNLGLAPISTSANHSLPPHPQYIPLNISLNPSSLHDSSILTRPSTHLSRSASQPSLIPSLLNQSRITKPPPDESIQHHQTEPIHPSTDSNNNHHQHQETPQPILAPPQEPCVANSPFQPATLVPEREIDLDLSNPPHIRDPIIHPPQLDTDSDPRPVHLTPKVAAKEPRKQPLSGFSFETSGKSFIKYALPKPRLEATLATPPSKIAQKSLKRHHRRGQSLNQNAGINTQSTITFPREIPDSPCADASMEILKERYWDAKHDNLDSQHVWAEIYISKLERQLWKSQAEEDISADCLRLCFPLGSHYNTPQKPQHSRRRAASASDAEKPRPGILTSLTRVADHNQTKTQKRARFDFVGFHKAFPNDIRRMKWSLQPGSPLEISDGPLNRLPCINSSCSPSSGVIAPRRSDFLFPTRRKSPSVHLSATNSVLLQPDTTPRVPPNIGSTYGYRIVRPTDNQQQLKSSRRRSRSVPDFRRVHYHPSSSPNLINGTAGFPSWAPREAASPNDLPIPQSFIDAMFPPVSDSPAIATSYPPEFLLSVDSGNKAVRRVSSTKNLRTSVCADIEASDNPDKFAFYDLPAVPDAPLEPTNKSHLQSLSRFTETRPPVVVPLPPPPRKRNNVTPTTGTNSSNQNSLVGVQRNSSQTKRSTSQTQRSTSDTNRSTVETKWSMSESMIANLSFATSSDKTGCNPPLSQRFTTHTSSSPPEPLPDIRAHRVFPSFIQAPDLDLLSPQRVRARSSSCAYPTSPTCDSPADSANRYSGFSQVSSPPCSMYAAHPYIERENRPSTFMAGSPPLSALNLNPATQNLPRYIQGASAHTCMPTIDVARTSCDSCPSESSNSVIDPDKPINQADLFYQVPASPRRSLIQDYDDNIVKSRRILEGHREKRKKTKAAKAAKRSGLIDGILAGCASPRRTKIVVTRRSIIETQQLPTESVIDPAVQRGQFRSAQSDSMTSPADWSQRGSRSAVIQKVPTITDAFESH
ncbi:hypothetical protein PCANC_19718 [Puccinia coronata f. sp. avenae]|uniref:Uncharacterized protein n=1 Tax=Puccinia coronata f. sp. avenae TaxID=200324 RepID=A0A2N5SBF2_9BASI|nr:hypothetical protein PCANC_19718 [Puccinia coronata f. sp. avenae]